VYCSPSVLAHQLRPPTSPPGLLPKALSDYFPTSTTISSISITTWCLDRLLSEAVRLLQQLCDYFLNKYDHSVPRSTTSTTRTTTSSTSATTQCLDRLLQQLVRLFSEGNLHCTEFIRLLQAGQSSMSAPAGNGASSTGPTSGCMCNFSIKMYPKIPFYLTLSLVVDRSKPR
jgi:hypothetical protein